MRRLIAIAAVARRRRSPRPRRRRARPRPTRRRSSTTSPRGSASPRTSFATPSRPRSPPGSTPPSPPASSRPSRARSSKQRIANAKGLGIGPAGDSPRSTRRSSRGSPRRTARRRREVPRHDAAGAPGGAPEREVARPDRDGEGEERRRARRRDRRPGEGSALAKAVANGQLTQQRADESSPGSRSACRCSSSGVAGAVRRTRLRPPRARRARPRHGALRPCRCAPT